MITMEFDEMKKIWNSQNNEPLYGFNEQALHNRILSKKRTTYHITNVSELLSIIVYVVTGIFIIGMNLYKQNGNIFMYILSVWMLCSAVYLLVSRVRRINTNQRFDRSMCGDLMHAISVATYQVHLSLIMCWNIFPIGLLTALGLWDAGKPIWVILGVLLFFALANYAAGWEHGIYKARKRELKTLQSKLENEDPDERLV